jgi:hypothetical protein
MLRIFMVLTMLATGAVTSQLPEFAQQYRQRLGGAIDALHQVLADFQADADRYGLSFSEAIERQKASSDPFIQARGDSMEMAGWRLAKLKDQKAGFETAGPLERILIIVHSPDRDLIQATTEDYVPAIPVTTAGLISSGIGAVGGLLIVWFFVGLRRLTRLRANA